MMRPAIEIRLARDSGDMQLQAAAEHALLALRTAADDAVGELRLMGPASIVMQAENVTEAVERFSPG